MRLTSHMTNLNRDINFNSRHVRTEEKMTYLLIWNNLPYMTLFAVCNLSKFLSRFIILKTLFTEGICRLLTNSHNLETSIKLLRSSDLHAVLCSGNHHIAWGTSLKTIVREHTLTYINKIQKPFRLLWVWAYLRWTVVKWKTLFLSGNHRHCILQVKKEKGPSRLLSAHSSKATIRDGVTKSIVCFCRF